MNKLISLFFVVILVAVATSGCGAGPSPTPSQEPPTPTAAAPPTPVSALPTPVSPLPTATAAPSPLEGGPAMPFEITSTAFAPGEPIPRRYTCDGEDVSPPLGWGDPPPGTQSFALICDDVDAPVGTWVHWVLYNLPAGTRSLPEAIPSEADLPDGGQHGENSWRRLGYGGPCPPSGTHRYFFKLYALDTALELAAGASKEQLFQAMEGHILAQAEVMGTYAR